MLSLFVFIKYHVEYDGISIIVFVYDFVIVFFGQVMSSHHSDQMSQRSQVSRIAPLGCSLIEVHRLVGR